MFSHVTLGSSDLARSASFYDAALAPLGLCQRAVQPDGGPAALSWHRPGDDGTTTLPHFFVVLPFDGQPASCGNGTMLAFAAPDPGAVDRGHAGGLANGGRCAGPPGLRAQYAADYYGAYLLDPDGNKIHIRYRGPLALNRPVK